MKKNRLNVLVICLIFSLTFFSCLKNSDTVMYYNALTYVNIEKGQIYDDYSNVLSIDENPLNINLDTLKRVVILYDLMRKINDTSYGVRLKGYFEPLQKEPLKKSQIPAGYFSDTVGYANAHLMSSGGYMNMTLYCHTNPNDSSVLTHEIVFDDIKSKADSLFFDLVQTSSTSLWKDTVFSSYQQKYLYFTVPLYPYIFSFQKIENIGIRDLISCFVSLISRPFKEKIVVVLNVPVLEDPSSKQKTVKVKSISIEVPFSQLQ